MLQNHMQKWKLNKEQSLRIKKNIKIKTKYKIAIRTMIIP